MNFKIRIKLMRVIYIVAKYSPFKKKIKMFYIYTLKKMKLIYLRLFNAVIKPALKASLFTILSNRKYACF